MGENTGIKGVESVQVQRGWVVGCAVAERRGGEVGLDLEDGRGGCLQTARGFWSGFLEAEEFGDSVPTRGPGERDPAGEDAAGLGVVVCTPDDDEETDEAVGCDVGPFPCGWWDPCLGLEVRNCLEMLWLLVCLCDVAGLLLSLHPSSSEMGELREVSLSKKTRVPLDA